MTAARRGKPDWLPMSRRERSARNEEFTAFAVEALARLRRTSYFLCGDWHLAQDLTQLALAKMYASWGRIPRDANLDAYSRRVLINLILDHRKRRSSSEVVLADLPEQAEQPFERSVELHVTLMRALATLPVRDQAIVVLRHGEDQSVETVAEILGVSVSVVKTQSLRALQHLRRLLGEDFARQ